MLRRMVSRTRFRTILTTLALYMGAALIIGYFGVHARSGNYGLRAKEDLAAQMQELSQEAARLKSERAEWERRVVLLRSDSLDPDMLDERARAMLDYVHPRDLVLVGKPAADAATPALASMR
jgi:cell division protein FtsB